MTTLKERFEKVWFNANWELKDDKSHPAALVRHFFSQELLALAEKVEKMKIPKPTCYCREYTLGAHDCGITSNEAVVDAAALIRSKADELV